MSTLTNSIGACLIAFLVTTATMPRLIRTLKSLKAGQIVSTDGPESHLAKQGTPAMGGIALLMGLILASVAMGLIGQVKGLGYGLRFGGAGMAAVLGLIAGNGLLGFLDDYLIVSRDKALGLKARHKLLGQFVLAIAFVVWLAYIGRDGVYPTIVRLPFIRFVDLGAFYYAFAVLFIVGMSNAVNLTDGLDGLVGGLASLTAVALAWSSLLAVGASGVAMDPALVIVCWAIAGACLGFLWFNAHPARVFMGDTGSLALGAGIAGIAVLTKQEFVLLFFGFIFVVEALSVIIQVISFKTTGKRVFKMSPIHHHFELSGWSETQVVARFWIIGLLACIAGVAVAVWMAA